MTPRELVNATLTFQNTTGKVPRELWSLPWARDTYPAEFAKIQNDFPNDILTAPSLFAQPSPVSSGDMYMPETYVDDWGCVFLNRQKGIIGEVKQPLVQDEEWEDCDAVHIPEEWLSFDRQAVDDFCAATDRFLLAGCYPRPFEQLQFIRGTENLFIDLMLQPPKMLDFIAKMHDFYCRQLELWGQTKVDALMIMDDWGTQKSLLISPSIWVEIFKPMYRDYIGIAKKYNKKMFMHSDGNTSSILPHLIELGLDAINTQIFCMDFQELEQFAGQITFWGEIDRQNLLPYATEEEIDAAVKSVMDTFWRDGGVIAQCEFGIGANPRNVYRAFEAWSK